MSFCAKQSAISTNKMYRDYESSLDPHFSNLLKGLASTASSTPSHIPSSPTSTASPSSSTKKGAIAGGVVGGLVFIALVAGLIFFLRRCRQPPPPPPKDSKFDSPWSPQLDGNAMSEVSGTFILLLNSPYLCHRDF